MKGMRAASGASNGIALLNIERHRILHARISSAISRIEDVQTSLKVTDKLDEDEVIALGHEATIAVAALHSALDMLTSIEPSS